MTVGGGKSRGMAVVRGEVYDARLDPGTEGSEQAGTRPVIVVSRDAINASGPVVLTVPCTTYRGQRLYPTQIVIAAPEAGFSVDSVALGEQLRALAKTRLLRRRGRIALDTLRQLERALQIALDLPRTTR